MWVDAGFSPDSFWHQSPRSFQLAMEGVRKRAEREANERVQQAWQIAALSATAMDGKLKPMKHYLARQSANTQSPAEMLALIRSLGARSNMTIKRLH